MYCAVIVLPLFNFSRLLDEVAAIHLASVSGLFASFRYQHMNSLPSQTPPIFYVNRPFSWNTVDLFLGLFSGFGSNIVWEVDNVVEFVQICGCFTFYLVISASGTMLNLSREECCDVLSVI